MNLLLKIMLKTLLIIIFVQNYLFAIENVKIILKIDDEIITNVDVQKEYNYLIALNNDFKEVNKERALLIAKESIIKEKIKKKEIEKYYNLEGFFTGIFDHSENFDYATLMKKLQSNTPSSSNFKELWVSAMLDDFNTAKAFGFYFKFINDGKLSNKSEIEIKEFEEVMGIYGWRNEINEDDKSKAFDNAKIEEIIKERNKARKEKDWDKADKLRELAESYGIKLLDNEKGTTWETI